MEVTVSPQGLSVIDRKSKLDIGSQERENSDSSRNGGWHCWEEVSGSPRLLEEAAESKRCAHVFLLEKGGSCFPAWSLSPESGTNIKVQGSLVSITYF